jgi:2-polyprenyl-3-methyl-5-hydroxy-6-metoxy-1,4-benzoquinol methylase
MPKIFNLNKEINKLLLTNKFYVKRNRNIKIKFERNYHGYIKDPDGNLRNLKKEKNFKLKQMKNIVSYLKKRKGKILDVGCGHGWMLSALNNKWKKYGVEISKFASKSASKYCKIFNGDLKNFKEKNFDVITALHIIEHHKKPESFLKLIKKKLKNKGIFILETPDFDCAAARKFGNNFRLLKDKTHISLFSQDSLIRLVRNYGFEIIEINYPFFETPYFNKKNLLRILDSKKKISPPFYGSTITLFLRKK